MYSVAQTKVVMAVGAASEHEACAVRASHRSLVGRYPSPFSDLR